MKNSPVASGLLLGLAAAVLFCVVGFGLLALGLRFSALVTSIAVTVITIAAGVARAAAKQRWQLLEFSEALVACAVSIITVLGAAWLYLGGLYN